MRDSSYQSSKQHKQMFSRGGEKKVMKKSLSLLLALAMVFSLFAGVVSAADDTLTTQQKFEALKAKGIFAGKGANQDPALDDNMTRAEGARIVALLTGAEGIGPTDTRVVTEKPFPDVEIDAWYAEEIDAVKDLGLFEGYEDGTFRPDENFTVQQLAVVIAKVLGLEPVEDAEVDGAASWAAGYIQALIDNGIQFPTNYTEFATRGQLVEATYAADQIINPEEPAKVSVVSAKATGVQKVLVTLDKAVDTEKATLSLKRNNSNVATKTVWAEDGKSATLELETKIMEGDYTVTLAGLDNDEIATREATFKGENERVVKLEFVAPSDYLPYAPKVSVQFRAVNQYDEPVSLAAGSFNAYSTTGTANVKKDANGNLYVEIATNGPNLTQNVSQISINVINTDSQISINKIFTLGSQPYVAKVELGDVVYSNGEDYLSKQGDKAVIELIQLDQYGHRITDDSLPLFNATGTIIPYLPEFEEVKIEDDNDDKIRDVVVKLKENAKASGEYTVTVFGGVSASKTINVKATNYAATIEFDTSKVLAEGDKDRYIPIIAYDKDGNKLSAQDIVDNYEEGHFQISTSGNLTLYTGTTKPTLAKNPNGQQAVVKAGEHKGKLYIEEVGLKGLANIHVNITPTSANGIMFNKSYQINIHEKRYPVGLKVIEDNAAKAIPFEGNVNSKLKLVAIDQHGDEYDLTTGEIRETNRTVTYDVYVEVLKNTGGVIFSDKNDGTGNQIPVGSSLALSNVLNKDWYFFAADGTPANEEFKVKISLRKIGWDPDAKVPTATVHDESVASVTKSMRVIPTNTKLTYNVKNIDTLFAAQDDPTYDGGPHDNVAQSKHARTVEIEAKDNSGDTVALPSDYVIGVSPADPKIVDTDSERKIIGNRAGTTQLAITHKRVDGTTNTVYKEVTVKDDRLTVASLSSKSERNDFELVDLDNADVAVIMDLAVKDNYNTEYKEDAILEYDKHLGIRYSVSDFQGITVRVDNKTGKLEVTSGGASGSSFVLTASSPNGLTTVTPVIVK